MVHPCFPSRGTCFLSTARATRVLPVTRHTRVLPVSAVPARVDDCTWFSPVFHGTSPVLAPTAFGPVLGPCPVVHVFCPCHRMWIRRCVAHGFPLFSMARYRFSSSDPWNTCFPREQSYTCYSRAGRSCPRRRLHMVFPCFPWRASSSGPDSRRTRLLPVSRGTRFFPSPWTCIRFAMMLSHFSSHLNVRQLLSLLVDHVHTHFRHTLSLFV
jgi:hypothetical protein